ncbi:hypothetical protein ACEWY4_016662 [Coilia grayii]|uniref:Chromo domain-containing protein n=1 Tax=Coilia grayii TaxID=363190 RepID=A0ABD1JM05_9TELE
MYHTYVARHFRVQLLTTAHCSPGTGHPGANATLSLLQDRYWWPGMARDVHSVYLVSNRHCFHGLEDLLMSQLLTVGIGKARGSGAKYTTSCSEPSTATVAMPMSDDPQHPKPGAAVDPPLPLLLDEGPVYAIHNILDSRRRRGRLEYLVDWEGYGPEYRSWVRRNDILDPDLLTEFHRTHASRPAPRSRGRPRRRTPLFLEAVPGEGAGGNVTTTPDSPPATSTISQSNSSIC